ncbi:MAG: InlB B-repeat-containing protein [Ruminococcus flavefaciens]|nr:InlB B-repeat-containing protein [Ruminococcus flavefaciens]
MKRILSVLLSCSLVLALISVSGVQEAKAYGIDYNFIENVLNEVGYGDWYDDSLNIIESSYNYYGGFGFKGNDVARYVVSTVKRLNGRTVITPMNQALFTECPYNVEYAKTKIEIKEGTTQEEIESQAKAWLSDLWNNGYNSLNINLTASGSFGYVNSYGGAVTTAAGNTLALVGLNDNKVTAVEVKVSAISQLGDYTFAKYTALKDLNYVLDGQTQEFPYAFAYGCTSLKYLTYPQNKDYVFGKYSFMNCSSLIHWTGMGKNGATQNWNNQTTSGSKYDFREYSFAQCSGITHIDFVSSDVSLNDYAFGQSGLTYIGFFDYDYYDKQDTLLEAYKINASALMKKDSISDKAFDGVSAARIYVAHKDIYDVMNLYQDGVYCGRQLAVANIHLSFDGTDSTGGSMESRVLRYDDDRYTLTNEFVKEGYVFAGFSSADMNDAILDNDYNAPHEGTDWISALQTNIGVTVLFPTWTPLESAIEYVLNGGNADGISLPATHTYGTPITSLDEPTKYGYDFDGWYEDEEFTKPFSGISETDTDSHTYYAKWKEHIITITYELDGGINHPDNPETLAYNSARVELKDPSRDGYDFAGWTTGDNDTMVTYLLAADGDQTLYALWNVHTYNITYELNGGTLTGDAPENYKYGDITYLVVPPVKDKYVFDGWYEDKDLTKRVYDIPADAYGDITLYAKWSEAVGILPIPEKAGYRFLGWVDKSGNSVQETEKLSDYEGNIYSNWLDIRWTISKKGSKTYINALKADYEWYAKKEKKGDKDSFTESTADGSIQIYGTADGYVTKKDISIDISGKIKAVKLTRNGKNVTIKSSYFDNKANNIYLKGYPITKNGVYVLTVESDTASKSITFMKDSAVPTVKGVVKKIVTTKTTLPKKVKTKTTKKKKGNTTTVTKQKGKTKTIKKTKTTTFKITQTRRFYVHKSTEKTEDKAVTSQYTASIKWSDSTAGVSSVYVNGKRLSEKKVKKGQYAFKKAGTYKVEVYDYIGNHYSKKIVVDKKNSDTKLPSLNMKNGASYYVGAKLTTYDKSGIKNIKITDWHGFTKTYQRDSYTFKNSGTYTVKVTDKVGNYKKIKIKIVKKPKY